MATYAEILNADDSFIRFLEEAPDWQPPAQKYGPAQVSRFVPVIRDGAPVYDPYVFNLTDVLVVSPTELHVVPTLVRKSDEDIANGVDSAAFQTIGGTNGLLFLARMAHVAAPTDIQLQMVDSILSVLTAADGLKSDPASVTEITSVLSAAVTSPLGGGGIKPSPGILVTP